MFMSICECDCKIGENCPFNHTYFCYEIKDFPLFVRLVYDA
jgi:hypothetical protein